MTPGERDSQVATPGGDRADAFKGQARSQFDAWADNYDRSLLHHFLFKPSYVVMMEEIAAWRDARPAATAPFRLLDIGCGTGNFISLLHANGWNVEACGMDYSPQMCIKAMSKPGFRDRAAWFAAGDSEHLPFRESSFDVVVCANSFHHYPHQQEVIRDVFRVLRPGGRFLLLDGFRDNAIGWFVFDVIITSVEKEVLHVPWSTMQAYFEAAGFRDISKRKFNVLFPVLCMRGDKT